MKMRTAIGVVPEPRPTRQWSISASAYFASNDDVGASDEPRRERVLIVEDDHLVALDVEAALLDAGLEVVGIAASADEALLLAKSEKPTIAVMDVRLYGSRDGVDAALELYRVTGVRCVFATAHSDPSTRLRAQSARPLGWVGKPYQPEALVRAVRDALDRLSKP